jgi:HPt (histidine-containing phosphotransfer) domain-containing protein
VLFRSNNINRLGKKIAESVFNKNLPIIALTANAVSGAKEMFIENRFSDFLSKPIDIIMLGAVLEKWIPKEKQQKILEENDTAEKQYIDAEIVIEGADVKKGISMTGGNVNRYLYILDLYCNCAREKIQKITTCLEEGNLSLYATHVHALKGVSASIGAIGIPETAETLERAGYRGDGEFIQAHNAEFLSNLEKLLNNIRQVITAKDREKREVSINMEKLKPELSRLKVAMHDCDISEINEASNNLKEFAHTDGIIKKILQYKLIGDYDEAILLIDKMLCKQ